MSDQLSYKLALTGSGGTGKTWIIDGIKAWAEDVGIIVKTIPSPTRYVKSLGFQINNEGDKTWLSQYMCAALRLERQVKAVEYLGEVEYNHTLLLADRCLMDELAYTRYNLEQAIKNTPVGETGEILELQQLYKLQSTLADSDVSEFWDEVWYKPMHPDFPPEADGDRISNMEFHNGTDLCFQKEGEARGILDLPKDREDALDFLIRKQLEPRFFPAKTSVRA